jgi:hypothetical protein
MSLTKRLMDYDGDAVELPAAAFTDPDTHEVDDAWLAGASRPQQLAAMRLWFMARYCDPQMETPYNSEDGGYFYVHGGPYDPNDVLQERFDFIDYPTIRILVEDLYADVGDEWAPTCRRWSTLTIAPARADQRFWC